MKNFFRPLAEFLLTFEFRYNIIKPTNSREEEKYLKKNERKQELLKIAYNMFLNKGYDNTSVDDIIFLFQKN